jgi:hypothetical protein
MKRSSSNANRSLASKRKKVALSDTNELLNVKSLRALRLRGRSFTLNEINEKLGTIFGIRQTGPLSDPMLFSSEINKRLESLEIDIKDCSHCSR